MAELTAYTFEDAEGIEQGYQCFSASEAREYAAEHSYRVIEHTYEWTDSEPVKGWDFTGTYAEPTEPEEGDYILCPSGNLGTHTAVVQSGRRLATFGPMGKGEKLRSGSDERALAFVRQHMEKEQFYPNVWLQDDHGGYTLTTL